MGFLLLMYKVSDADLVSCVVSVPAALRSLCLLVERRLLCENWTGIPADARQRRHDQSSEPSSHSRPLGHLQRGNTQVTLLTSYSMTVRF